MSCIVYSRWHLRPGADRRDLGAIALNFCRVQRQNDGVLSTRYFWADTNNVVMLTELDSPQHVFANAPSEAGSKLLFDLGDVADRTGWEVWMDARAGTEANKLAGR